MAAGSWRNHAECWTVVPRLDALESGPSWRSVVQDVNGAPFLELQHNGIDVQTERLLYGTGTEPPECARCGQPIDEDLNDFGALVETWIDEGEPTVRCEACGADALLGDWQGERPYGFVGAPFVEFNNWFRLTDQFIGELHRQLGGRCRTLRYKV